MIFSARARRLATAGLSACALLAGAGAALTATAASAAPSGPATPACISSNLTVWTGSPGDNALGHSFWQVEVSNVGHHSCTLFGYPGVSVINGGGHQVGKPASHSGHKVTVTIPAGGTSHFLLTVTDPFIVCAHPVHASELKVFAPGQFHAKTTPFPVAVCPHKVTLHVDAVHPGTGIPGHTTF
ncbi:MAG TPA: DUF4232 domain-containing protein [Streptosporangiaceae bacterium]|nr:DUF4232 domain-containing protein [Streptosporangiaceae bacterium]